MATAHSRVYASGPNKRKWDYLERYEKHLVTSMAPTSTPPTTNPLQLYLQAKKPTRVRVFFDSESDSDSDEESIAVRPSFSDDEDDYEGVPSVARGHQQRDTSRLVAHHSVPTAAAAATAREPVENDSKPPAKPKAQPPSSSPAKSAGNSDDPIVLSDSDDDDDQPVVVAVVKSSSPPVPATILSNPSPNLAQATASSSLTTAASSSPNSTRQVSYESSCESSAMSSTMPTPTGRDPRTPRRLQYQSDESSVLESDSEMSFDSDLASVDSEQAADEFYCSPPPRDPTSLFSFEEFKHLWRLSEKNIGEKTEVIENGRLIRQANTKMVSDDTRAQLKAQYGRILPTATHKLLREILQVERTDVFVDVGHGIGNAVLQAAYTMGCESRGIEVVRDRNAIAQVFQRELKDLARLRHDVFDDPRETQVGAIELKHGRLELSEHRDFLTNPGRVTKAFVNNFDGVFAERSAKSNQTYHLDHFIAGLFALMAPGSIMVTLHPLTLGHSVETSNEIRRRHGLKESKIASFFKSQTVTLGEARDVVSWSQGGSNRKPIQVYVYTRLHQPGHESAVFLCNNPKCKKARKLIPQAAVGFVDADGEEGERMVIAECECGIGARPVRARRRVSDYADVERIQWPY